MILHEIMPSSEYYQNNGVSWSEEATLNAIDTIQGCPICAEFLDANETDGKSEPWDHGLTGEITTDEGRIPVFLNSEVVGSLTKGYIKEIEIGGVSKKVCMADGYIYQHRVPNLIDWISENTNKGTANVSVEICGNAENQNRIIYENGATGNDIGRRPLYYSYSGVALLNPLVKAADPVAKILEINSNNKNQTESEENILDEKTLNQFITDIKGVITETNSKNSEYEAQINELNNKITELNSTIDELTTKLTESETVKTETENKITELNSTIEQLNGAIEEAKKKERINELNAALADYSDDEKSYAKDEIDKFNADPMSVEINSIVTKIDATAYRKMKEAKKISETNAANKSNTPVEDIFGDICETNSAKGADDDDNIF